MPRVETYREFDTLVPASAHADALRRVFCCGEFAKLRDFVLRADESDDFFRYSKRRGIGECITLRNYVGVVCFANGRQIEILPKIASDDDVAARRLVLNMLRCLTHTPFREGGTAALSTCRMPLMEAFISMFVQEVQALVRSGIRADYVPRRGNLNCLRGRLLPTCQLRRNLLHPERLFCAYDEYDLNCPENRLVKTTLLMLRRYSASAGLLRSINELLLHFDGVECSSSVEADFNKVRTDRSRRVYAQLLHWARVFLSRRSFSNFAGNTDACALLFPMERLFEDYVAYHVRRTFGNADWSVKPQAGGHFLFSTDAERHFPIRLDILARKAGRTIVMDTKWKRLENDPSKHYGISTADMYQMKAYADTLNTSEIYLLYPRLEWMSVNKPLKVYHDDASGLNVHVYPVDMLQVKESIGALKAETEPAVP